MPTSTDTMWTARLNGKVPSNFSANVATAFTAQSGVLNNLINRIGKTIVEACDNVYNPFAKFNKDTLEFGDTVQKYKVPFVAGAAYNPSATTPFAQNNVAPIAQYDTLDFSQQYHITLHDTDLKKAFVNDGAFTKFVEAQADSLMQSYGLDLWLAWKKYISATTEIVADDTTVTEGTTYASDLLDCIRSYTNNKFRFPATAYNKAADTAVSNKVTCIICAADKLQIDKTLEGIYNLEKAKLDCEFITIDSFATGASNADYRAMIVDDRALEYFPKPVTVETIRNPQARTTEMFVTIEGVLAINRFRNAIRIAVQAE